MTRIIKVNNPGEDMITGLTLVKDANGDYFAEMEAFHGRISSAWAKARDNETVHDLLVEAGLE